MVLTEKCSVLTIFEETDVSAKLIHLLVYKFVNSSRQSSFLNLTSVYSDILFNDGDVF